MSFQFSNDLSKKDENTNLMESCCDTLEFNPPLTLEDPEINNEEHSRNYTRQDMFEFINYVENKHIPFNLEYIFNKYRNVWDEIEDDNFRQVTNEEIMRRFTPRQEQENEQENEDEEQQQEDNQ